MQRFPRFGTVFVQFKKREKHPWKDVTFSKIAALSLQLC